MCESYGAILGINANGFYDPNGEGYGDKAEGLLLSEGTIYNPITYGGYFQIGGYDYDDYFRVGYGLDTDELGDASQFFPNSGSKWGKRDNRKCKRFWHPAAHLYWTNINVKNAYAGH